MTRARALAGALGGTLVLLLAACGGGAGSTTSGVLGTTSTKTSPAAEKAQIAHVWTTFFAGSTSASTKASLLQNGSTFEPVIAAQSKSTLAKQTKATVSKVTLVGATKAKVVYTISIGGTAALKNRTGTAVRVNGSWKVADTAFCQLLGLQGTPPKGCSAG